jgi:hypothetical protein
MPDMKKPIHVKVGYTQSCVTFPLKHLFPETTTEQPPLVSAKDARPVIFTEGTRVVIIGPDRNNNSEFVGHYASIVRCPFIAGFTGVRLHGSSDQLLYCSQNSLCRSIAEPVEWFDRTFY